jgi:hypothetical protein
MTLISPAFLSEELAYPQVLEVGQGIRTSAARVLGARGRKIDRNCRSRMHVADRMRSAARLAQAARRALMA